MIITYISYHFPIDIDTFGFVEREIIDGKKLRNKCGRDFLYYALHYYHPTKFNPQYCSPTDIINKGLFGLKYIPVWLEWTGLSFLRMPIFLASQDLVLTINEKKINRYIDFLYVLAPFYRMSYEKGIKIIEEAVRSGKVVGVDIGISLGGLVDHVMFVYGYDKDNLYIFDTNSVDGLEYEKLTPEGDTRYIMKLSKEVARKRWGIMGRVWLIEKK